MRNLILLVCEHVGNCCYLGWGDNNKFFPLQYLLWQMAMSDDGGSGAGTQQPPLQTNNKIEIKCTKVVKLSKN